jgi:hypothetical protein
LIGQEEARIRQDMVLKAFRKGSSRPSGVMVHVALTTPSQPLFATYLRGSLLQVLWES